MGLVLLVVLVFVLAAAAYVDHRDRRHGYQRRGAGDMIRRRRERLENLKSTPVHGVPLDDDWDRPVADRLREKQDGEG